MQSHKFQVLLATAIFAISFNLASSADINCYLCNSENSTTCISTPTDQTTVLACSSNCVTYQDKNNTLVRGCASACPADAQSCQTCNTDKCNTNLVCQECKSTQDCAVISKLPATLDVCTSNQVCLSILNDDSTVSRNCGAQTDCTDAAKCSSCSTGKCNNALFPANRLQCYSCSGAECNTVNANMLTACGLNSASCYTIGTSATTMQRGCTSDADTKCSATTTDASCLLCNGETGCNKNPFTRDGVSCVQCTNCAGLQQTTDGKTCGALNYTQSSGCYTQTKDNVVDRGCLNALAAGVTCSSENQCTTCDTANCNTALVETKFTCLRCNSNDNPECIGNSVIGTECSNASDTTCFVGRWGELVVRDCWDEASVLMQYQCDNKLYGCEKCTTPNCNNFNYSAASLSQISLGLIMASFVLTYLRRV